MKQLQRTIDKQLDNSPLSKKMKASEIYQERNSKNNAIIQTSAHDINVSRLSMGSRKKEEFNEKVPKKS